ncbi:hypothetical protein [Curtobacterium poinsettiae]|uniref:hypothetical protein n=1 Tax=Curtobacterium TaxID=2034 RepID=UPI00217DDF28|nr:hypothetical protein [Curtobacterium flaccumfaciens]MCS6563437.1 hypothetical protein [Curtobacterium flaccumfaciens pv. poinsettiae]UXN27233.1 hypothetical protein N8D75_08830 [Curtobacterium flaccumfaciens]
MSDTSAFSVDLTAFGEGLGALGIPRGKKVVQPQQTAIATLLEARKPDGNYAYPISAVLVPRRASKTTTVFGVAIGRALSNDDFNIGVTAQNGSKARQRFLSDIVAPLERTYRDVPEDERGFRINRGRGSERVIFDNGSIIQVLPPLPDSWRGDAFDMVIFDEAQSLDNDPDFIADLLGAVLPTLDTTGGQLIFAGTAGVQRSGVFWDTLSKAIAGDPDHGVIYYGAPDTTDPADYLDPEVIAAAHPGVGTLTTLDAVLRNGAAMNPTSFAQEYLSIWGSTNGVAFIDPALWEAARYTGALPEPPASMALAYEVDWSGSSAAVVAGWRDGDGLGHTLLLDHRPGTDWVAEYVGELSRKYRVPVTYDSHAQNLVVAETLQRLKPRPRLDPIAGTKPVAIAAALYMRELGDGRVRHYDQPAMNAASENAAKRAYRKDTAQWLFGRSDPTKDISPIVAASVALWAADGRAGKTRLQPVIVAV